VIDADGTIVRGLTLISFSEAAIHIRDASDCHIEGNVLGDDGSDTSFGVLIEGGSGNVVGGREPGQGNRIEHPSSYYSGLGIGVELRPGANGPAIANRIEGNRILNMAYGVVATGYENTIGGLAAGAGNAIEGFRIAGVLVSDANGPSRGIAILSNSITGFDLLGIDLGGDGPTPNDLFDADGGANDLQNHPVLERARVGAGTVTIAGALHSTLFTEFRIELFASVNVPPAEMYLGSITGTSDVEGKLEFEASFPWDSISLGTIVATATNLETGDTSEVSDFVEMRQLLDRDGDRVEDELDDCPDLPNPDQADTDADGAGDACDADDDDDGLSDSYESAYACLDVLVPDAGADADADGLTNVEESSLGSDPCKLDSDDDGLPDAVEIFGFGAFGTDPLDPDTDDDGALDGSDNCPKLFYEETNQSGSNPNQADTDGDAAGDACDADDDDDGLSDSYESAYACLDALVPDAGADADGDGLTNVEESSLGSDPCKLDSDDDGLPDAVEIFGFGAFGTDPLDPDTDDDGALDGSDNCPKLFHEETNQSGSNPNQADLDRDGLGNVCDPDADGDGILNAVDSCRMSSAAGFDADSDGCRDSVSGFAGLVRGLSDVTESIRKTILRKTAEVEHLLCDVENVNGGSNKLRDLGDYVSAQTGKSIPAGTSEILRSYLDSLTQLIGNGYDSCSLP
jgi:hypothetical protein